MRMWTRSKFTRLRLRSSRRGRATEWPIEKLTTPSFIFLGKRSQMKRRREIIAPARSSGDIRPIRSETRLALVTAIACGRRWLYEIVTGTVADVEAIAAREKCSIRQVNMTISPRLPLTHASNSRRRRPTTTRHRRCPSTRRACRMVETTRDARAGLLRTSDSGF